MSVEEFKLTAQKYFLKAPHPYIQAYQFAIEAAEMAIYTPLYYARPKVSEADISFVFCRKLYLLPSTLLGSLHSEILH